MDLISSLFGKATDFEDGDTPLTLGHTAHVRTSEISSLCSDIPCIEPNFGTRYWSHPISPNVLEKWSRAAEPQLPPTSSSIKMPPINPYVPRRFDLKLSADDNTQHSDDGEYEGLNYGDDSCLNIDDGLCFPPIPSATPESRLPICVCDTQVSPQLKVW